MLVTYRLAGVDGEATEEVVDTLADSESAGDQDPELKFGIARDIAEVCVCVFTEICKSQQKSVGWHYRRQGAHNIFSYEYSANTEGCLGRLCPF